MHGDPNPTDGEDARTRPDAFDPAEAASDTENRPVWQAAKQDERDGVSDGFDGTRGRLPLGRRRVLGIAGVIAAGAASPAVGAQTDQTEGTDGTPEDASDGSSDSSGESDDATDGTGEGGWVVEQGGTCVAISPLAGDASAEAFYELEREGIGRDGEPMRSLQARGTSILFLYRDGAGDVYLVVVHGKQESTEAGRGGSASFVFEGLPDDGSWVVQDDSYAGPTRYDVWNVDDEPQTVRWTWQAGWKDGGVYGPLDGDDASFAVRPRFNEEAELYGEHYQGEVDSWEVLSGSLDDPDRSTLGMDEPVTVRTGECDATMSYSRDEISRAKYDLPFADMSAETAGQVEELFNRQPFADGMAPAALLTREEIAEGEHGESLSALGRDAIVSVEHRYHAQFACPTGADGGEEPYTREELSRAKWDWPYADLSVESTREIEELYLRQPFVDDAEPESVLTREQIAEEAHGAAFDELDRTRRVEVQDRFDGQFVCSANQ